MTAIISYLRSGESAFEPEDITAMSTALDDVCRTLRLNGNTSAKETMAVRIIDLARVGERNPTRLRDRVLHEAAMASHVNLGDESEQTNNNVGALASLDSTRQSTVTPFAEGL